jgi:hypothetical protein
MRDNASLTLVRAVVPSAERSFPSFKLVKSQDTCVQTRHRNGLHIGHWMEEVTGREGFMTKGLSSEPGDTV